MLRIEIVSIILFVSISKLCNNVFKIENQKQKTIMKLESLVVVCSYYFIIVEKNIQNLKSHRGLALRFLIVYDFNVLLYTKEVYMLLSF